jgi:hypothetical protein
MTAFGRILHLLHWSFGISGGFRRISGINLQLFPVRVVEPEA